ncbi:uncharacterized protein F4812DRAFT_461190 [Daldinia caldariorum]|uniref:uncharacterized protein n=1 Tax=Daldinia caldariorum TaxID=326644 RepID=UPI002008E8FD|nr:uncharacterized protein F4812DRAFT_461190 [Daldinia caldariorum]KAI1466219.1 hypothetical protein F4812DRAFT_461190 [Daldinia caldariorum]
MSQPLVFLVAFSAVVGTSEAIRQIQTDSKRKEHRSRKNNLIVRCPKSSQFSHLLEGRRVVLSGDKLYIDTGSDHDQVFGHPFAGYFLPYPDSKYSGLVSTICDEPPVMNWIYIDRNTYELKFGTRPSAQPNWPGPFDCSRQDRRLTFAGWEGFLAVKEGDFWALYFDVDEDSLKSKVKSDTPVLDIELLRVEMRVTPTREKKPSNRESEDDAESKKDESGPNKAQREKDNEEKIGVSGDVELESPEVD